MTSKTSKRDLQQLIQEMDELLQLLQRRQEKIQQQILEHIEYHKKNEGKWGFVKLISEHALKIITAALMLGMLLGMLFGRTKLFDDLIKILGIFK